MIPILFVETPRAGRHNYRFITSNNYVGDDELLSYFADNARQQLEGDNFLAANIQVNQPTSGRTGLEQIILANVAVKDLSDKQKTIIQQYLKDRLPNDVKQLITNDIDWNKNRQIIILHQTLTEWLQQLTKAIGTLPSAPDVVLLTTKQTQPQKKRKWYIKPKTKMGITAASIVGIIAIAIIASGSFNGKHNNLQEQEIRLIAAINLHAKQPIQTELKQYEPLPDEYAAYTSDTWPLRILFHYFRKEQQNDFVASLWGQPITNLQIRHSNGGLQPLVECRNAIRRLMLTNPENIYTPFFQLSDFGERINNPSEALKTKVYKWTVEDHPDALESRDKTNGDECSAKPKPSENLIAWIKECIQPIEGKFKKDKYLQKIKSIGATCNKVKFILN
ncbi:hypothetical protein TI03_00660 [Achromatium sp. WMS1]|nr:hypothetical protein TI03_00660 [Achromatium sp. WMS1]